MINSKTNNKSNSPEPRLIFTKIKGKLTLLTKDELSLLFDYKTADEDKQNEILAFIENLNK